MTILEWIAVLFACIIILKAIFFNVLKPKPLSDFGKKLYSNTTCMTVVFFIAAVLLGYVLSLELSPEYLMVGMIFGVAMMMVAFVQFPKALDMLTSELLKHRLRLWPAWILFGALAVWTLWTLLM